MYSYSLFEDYYHKKLLLREDRILKPNLSKDDLSKIKLAWNLGVGPYPQKGLWMRLGEIIANYCSPKIGHKIGNINGSFKNISKDRIGHAIFSTHGHPYIDYQRKIIQEVFKKDNSIILNKLKRKEYYELMGRSLITFSPFGWGEVCYREFEAILSHSLVIKPDMDHLETFPNVFIKNKTYIPLDWDLSNLKEITEHYFNHPEESQMIAKSAYECYRKELDKTQDKLLEVLSLLN